MDDQEQTLASQIIEDARKCAERIKQRAEAEARTVTAEAAQSVTAARDGALQEAKARAARRERVNRALIQQEVRRLRLQRRQEILERARAETERRLAELAAGPAYRGSLKNLALRAIQAMSGSRFQLVLRPEDRQACGEWLLAEVRADAREKLGRDVELALADETLEASGGLIVKGADGHEAADQTFEARLRRLWDQVRAEIAGMLPDAETAE
jgi:V/A-type H+-transporting ATPase subunit E